MKRSDGRLHSLTSGVIGLLTKHHLDREAKGLQRRTKLIEDGHHDSRMAHQRRSIAMGPQDANRRNATLLAQGHERNRDEQVIDERPGLGNRYPIAERIEMIA